MNSVGMDWDGFKMWCAKVIQSSRRRSLTITTRSNGPIAFTLKYFRASHQTMRFGSVCVAVLSMTKNDSSWLEFTLTQVTDMPGVPETQACERDYCETVIDERAWHSDVHEKQRQAQADMAEMAAKNVGRRVDYIDPNGNHRSRIEYPAWSGRLNPWRGIYKEAEELTKAKAHDVTVDFSKNPLQGLGDALTKAFEAIGETQEWNRSRAMEEELAIAAGKYLDVSECVAARMADLGWMVKPFINPAVGAFGHPDLLAAIDEFDDINCDAKTGKYRLDIYTQMPRFHMPLEEFLRRCRLNEKHKRGGQ